MSRMANKYRDRGGKGEARGENAPLSPVGWALLYTLYTAEKSTLKGTSPQTRVVCCSQNPSSGSTCSTAGFSSREYAPRDGSSSTDLDVLYLRQPHSGGWRGSSGKTHVQYNFFTHLLSVETGTVRTYACACNPAGRLLSAVVFGTTFGGGGQLWWWWLWWRRRLRWQR